MSLQNPSYAKHTNVNSLLKNHGFCILDAASVAQWLNCSGTELNALSGAWHDLPHDNFLKDGGHYRLRRHACFVFENDRLTLVPARAHWQSLSYNALHGGMQRWFEPMQTQTVQQPVWLDLLSAFARTADALHRSNHPTSTVTRWCIEAHQFRIDTKDGIGRPTPEGAHRDGVDLVGVFMINRQHVKGGETRVFDARGTSGQRFTLSESWSLLLLDDARVIHETTPIQPAQPGGYRDTLVLTCRAGSFQGE